MKYAFLILLLLSFACRKEEAFWDELTPAQKQAIRERAYEECIDKVGGITAEFANDSADVYGSSRWQRNDSWKHTFKQDTTSKITKVRVWKNDGTTLYLAVSETSENPVEQYFVRIPLATNEAMIEDLREQICRELDVDGYKGDKDGPLSVTNSYNVNAAGEVHTYTDTYNFNFSLLAFMGTQWNVKRRIIKKDTNGKQYEDKTWTSEFVELDGEPNLSANPNSWSTIYCDVYLPPANATYPDINYVTPYQLGWNDPAPTLSTCRNDGSLPAGWNLAI